MRDDTYCLTKLPIGNSARVKEICITGSLRRRLQDIGLIEGTKIKCLFKNPSGSPIAFFIRGAVIALRKEETDRIILFGNKGGILWD